RSAVVSPSSALLPCSRPRLAIPFAQPPLRAAAFAAASSPLLRPVGARFSLFSSMAAAASSASSVHDFTVKDASGKDVDLSTYKGKVLLIVNVASQWYELLLLLLHICSLSFMFNFFMSCEII
uniref:Glutathione peroxidase n=1 Tax=Aegilops tauschii subsp. strangulata TaxID=200361 RepID=A0A453P843_AEGTS